MPPAIGGPSRRAELASELCIRHGEAMGNRLLDAALRADEVQRENYDSRGQNGTEREAREQTVVFHRAHKPPRVQAVPAGLPQISLRNDLLHRDVLSL